jgi:hypothetical protein
MEREGDIRGLVRVLEDTSADCTTKAESAQALEHIMISYGRAVRIDIAAVVAAGAIPLLAELLRGGSDKGRFAAARVLGTLADAYGRPQYATAVVVAGAIPSLVALLRDGSNEGRQRPR